MKRRNQIIAILLTGALVGNSVSWDILAMDSNITEESLFSDGASASDNTEEDNSDISDDTTDTFSDGENTNTIPEVEENKDSNEVNAMTDLELDTGAFHIENGVLTAYTGADEEVIIPDGVTEIGERVFMNNTNVKRIVLPETVIKIGKSAFNGCTSMEEINIPSGVTEIENAAFAGCMNLKGNLKLPEGLKAIRSFAFYDCRSLNGDLIIPDSVEVLEYDAFYNCYGFNGSLKLSKNLTELDNYVFFGCSGLIGTVTIPDQVKWVGKYALSECSGLTDIVFGKGVTNICSYYDGEGITALKDCSNLETITFLGENVPILDKNNTSSTSGEGYAGYLFNLEKLKKIIVPKGYYGVYNNAYGNYLQSYTNIVETGSEDFAIKNGVLTEYLGEAEEVTVPDGVTEIAAAVFMNNSTIEKVILPDTVEKIGDDAFRNCGNLEVITLSSGLKMIGSRGFYNCKNLKGNLTLPEGLKTIGNESFYECSGLSGNLVIPDSVETIGNSAFYNCNGFKGTLKLSANLTELSNSVFSGCSGLTGTVIVPDSVKKIGIYAFYNCSNLTDLVVGKGVTNIYSYYYWSSARTAWQGCNNLETITFLGEKVPIVNESLTATTSNYINYLFNLENLKKIIVPEGSYGAYSSAYGSYLQSHTRIIESGSEDFIIENGTLIAYIGEDKEVTIPDGVTEIGAKAFLNNSEVKKIILPDAVEKIGNESFRGCSSLEEMELPSGLREIGTSAFSGCTGLKKAELPENLETIGNSAFYDCISLSGDLVIPDKVKTIGSSAFNYCKSLNGKLVLPENLEEIGSSAFYSCSGLTGKLTLPNGLRVIKDRAFYGCQSLTGDLIIPNSVETVGEYAFYDCYGFNGALKLSENLEELTNSVFYNCNGLTGTVTIPDSVKKIGSYALANCRSLTDLVVGKGVTNIYSYYYWSSARTAWQGCNSLETITFLGEKEPIVNESLTATSSNTSYIGYLFNLENLKKIIVPKGCYSIYSSAYGSYLQSHTRIIESGSEDFLIEDGVLTAYVGDAEEVSVPDGVTEIGTQAFLNNTGVKRVTLPETVERIGDGAFRGCSSLEEMELPAGLKEIGKSAFSGCINMKGTTLPEGLEKLGASAFSNCKSLTGELVIPDKIKIVGDGAFSYCSGLDGTLTLPENLEEIGGSAFYKCSGLTGGLILPENLKTIKDHAFDGCANLTGNLVIPDSVETVGSYAFYDCSGLNGTLKLSEKMTQISDSVFYNCKGLTGTVTIPDNIKWIGSRALANCSSLTDLVVGRGVTNIYTYYYWSSATTAWQGCDGLETITFLGETVPIVNDSITSTSSNTSYIGYLFNLKNLKKLIVPEGCYSVYSSAYGNYLQSYTRIIEAGEQDFIIENGVLTAYVGEAEEVSVPDGVTEIGKQAFLNNTGVKRVTLPETVEKIGDGAFRGCSDLEEMELPAGLKEIGNSAFSGCINMKGITLPKGLEKLGTYAFSSCKSLTGNLVIPDKIKIIGDGAFNSCSGLDGALTLPEGLDEIGSYAFYKCSGLTGVLTLPENLKTIKDYAFNGCVNLTGNLVIPDSVETVGSYAFYDCIGLNGTLKLSEKMTQLSNYVFYNCSGLKGTVTIPDNVKTIGSRAFNSCKGLTELVIGKGVTNIYAYYYSSATTAWQGCDGLETITFLGEKVPIISDSLTATSSNTSYISRLFELKNLKKLIVPEGCYSIYSSAYGNYLQSYTRIVEAGEQDFIIENGVLTAYVGDAEEVSIPDGVTEIGAQAFLNNTEVKRVTLPKSVKKIGDGAFRGCSNLEEMEFPADLKKIGNNAFSGCINMKGITLPEGLEKLGAYAFSSCKSLTGNLVIPDTIKIIGDGAFSSCSGLNGTLILPEGLEEIGGSAFYKCSGLTGALTLPENLKTIKDHAFDGCANLTGNLVIPDSVETVGSYAFYDCSGLNGTLKLSEKMTQLSSYVFYNCNGLRGTVTIPDNVKTIGSCAFNNCKGLTDLVVGKGVTNIYAYYYWSSATTAWQGCDSLEAITFLGARVPIISDSLTATSSNTSYIGRLFNLKNLKTIYVMQESLEKYQSAWSAYIPSTVSFSADTLQLPVSNFSSTYTGSHSVELSWAPFVNSDIIGYRIYRDGELIGETSDTLFSDTSLETERTYKYSIQGYTEDNCTTKETQLEITTQSPKVKSIYTDNKLNKLGLENGNLYALVQDSGNLRDAVGSFYYIDEQLKRHEIGTKLTSYISSNKEGAVYKTIWDLTDIPVGTYTVYFELADADGESDIASQTIVIDNTVPEALANVIAVGDTNQIVLSWTMAHEVDTTKYYIYRKAEDEDDYTLIKKVYDRNTLSYTDTKAKENKKYYYYITGVNSFGREGKPSAIAVATPLTDTEAPRVVQLTPVNGSIIGGNVELYANAQDNVAVVKTELYISEDDGQTWHLLKSMNDSYCSYTLSTKQYEDEIISIKGLAYDARGNVSTPLIYKYKIDNTGPEKVTGLSYESTATTVTLRWNDVADNDLAFFRVERKKDDGSFEKVEDVKSTLGINIYNLESDKEYVYRVVAYDQQGNRGEESDEITVKTQPDTIAPVITSIQPNANYYNKEIPLRITATDNTGIAGMTLQTSTNTIVWKDYKSLILSGINKTETVSETISLENLPEGDLYIRAIAVDAAGNKSDSSESAPYVQYIVDRTAPKTPENLKADAITGAIQITWDMGTENDIDGYQVLRSTDGENYTVIADGLHSVNYWDRSAEKDVIYWYKVAVSDQAGNISAATEAVKSILPEDNEPPKIESFVPTAGSTIGVSNSRFSVMASDNWKVDKVSVTYTVNDNETVKMLVNETGINNYYKVVSADIPLDTLKDGDVLHLSISVTDIQGMTTSKDGITYTIDKTAPRVNSVSTESAEDRITVRWSGNAEDDLAGYKIYRKTANGSYTLIAQRSAGSGTEYQYQDYNALAKETYYYKIEAIDKYGNTRAKESEAAWITVKPTVSANLACDKVLELNTEYYFDASGSYSDIGMKSYEFDFGDGTVITGSNAKVVHRYTATGTYTVHLTVTDEQENQSEIEKLITVEEPKLLGTIKVKTVDASGNTIADMPIYFDMDNSSDNVKYTGSDGTVTFNAGAGSYTIGTYANGYLPVKKSVVIKAGTEVELTLTVVKEPIVTGQFEINRMTLDEIKAAGIDVSDPANQQVVKVTLHLVYGSTPITMNVITNGDKIYSGETTIVDTGEEKRQLTATVINTNSTGNSTGTGSGTGIGSAGNNVIIAIMDVPVEASCLKEFFDVKLHIINHADTEYELTNNTVKLNVSDGMTLMDSKYTTSDNTIYFGSLKGQEEKTISWILRGDKAGKYDLTADYSAILQQFNVAVNAQFKTKTPITVYGLDAMKLVADINKEVVYGGMYFNLSLQNVGGADMNLPTLDVDGKIQSLYEKKAGESYSSEDQIPEGEKKDREVNLLDVLLKNTSGYSQSLGKNGNVEKLSAGEILTKKYVSYNVTSEDIAYLQKAITEVASELGIAVEINMVDMDLYSIDDADDKADSIFTDKNKYNLYQFFINNDNFHYYIDAENDDENYLKRLGMTIYGLADFVFTWDTDIFTRKNMKDMTRKYVSEMLKDESFQKAVDNKIDDTYLKTAKKVISVISGALPEDKGDVLYEDTTVKNIKATLKESKNIRILASSLKEGGTDAFWDRLLTLTLSAGGSVGVEYLKLHVQKNEVAGWFGSAMSDQLSEISDILSVFSNASVAWNSSVEITNQLVTINAAQYESILLMNMLLSHNEINKFVYEELQEINEGLVNGFKTQSDVFVEEFLKAEIKDGVTSGISTVARLIGKTYFPNVQSISGPVFVALQLAFGAFDYTLDWGDSVSMADSLRVAASLTYALRSETLRMQGSGDNEGFLLALKYLIKIRIIGESTWVDLCKDKGATEVKPGFAGEEPQILDDYISIFKSTILSYRDSLFGEVSETYNVPEAPKVYLNYSTETTLDAYDESYEYSFDGTDWTTCDGNTIPLNPGTVGRHLWVRVKATEDNLSGNITKIYVPARPALSGDIKVKYKKGTYYIEGLSKKAFYQLSDGTLENIEETQILEPENGKVTLSDIGEYHPYLALVQAPQADIFRSAIRNIVVEKAKKITLVNDDNMGEVSGEDEYFEGDMVQLKAVAKEGYDFVGWYEEGQLLSDQNEYSFECYSDHTIEARYEETKSVKVTFTGWNQSVLREDKYVFDLDDASKIVVPSAPILDGYDFVGWSLYDQVYANDKIQEAVYNRLSERKDIQIEAKYTQKEETHTVTVINGTLPDGKSSGEYQNSSVVIVEADEAETGKKFAYWKKDGVIVGYEKIYTFYMPNQDTVLEAVYEDETSLVEANGVSYIESVNSDINMRRVTFVSIGTVPDGCSIEYSGIVATSNPDKAINGIALTSENADYIRGGGKGYKSYKYTWTKGNVTDEQTWYVRSYLKYHDAQGNIYEIYSDIYTASLRTQVVFNGWNNEILSNKEYARNLSDITVIEIPSVPVIDGYNFVGWLLNGEIYSQTDIQTVIGKLLSDGKKITVKAQYKQKEEEYKITVKNGNLENGKREGFYKASTLLTITADEPTDGEEFAYWKKDSAIVSYDATYKFYMPSEDTVLEAVYKETDTPVESAGIAYIESVIPNAEANTLSFVSIGTVPDGCKIEYAGIVATSDVAKTMEYEGLTVANADYVRGGGKGYKTYKYTWTKGKVTEDQIWYVRAYLKYADSDGDIHEIYSDVMSGQIIR